MWGSPENYLHIATEQRRSLTINWSGNGLEDFDKLQAAASNAGSDVADFVRELLRRAV
jgi:hypothetical protein